jgi:hypothetical protein
MKFVFISTLHKLYLATELSGYSNIFRMNHTRFTQVKIMFCPTAGRPVCPGMKYKFGLTTRSSLPSDSCRLVEGRSVVCLSHRKQYSVCGQYVHFTFHILLNECIYVHIYMKLCIYNIYKASVRPCSA